MFAQHFPASEFQRVSDRALSPGELAYAERLSHRLELIRHALGDVPLVLTSYKRSGAVTDTNEPSQHRDGSAVDVRRPEHISWVKLATTVDALQHAGLTWGQVILYPWETPRQHFHISLPTGTRRQELSVKVAPGDYRPWSVQLASTFPSGQATPADATAVATAAVPRRSSSALVAVAGGAAAALALAALRGE
ncbi:MAG: hypothetical protein AB1762_12900 [Gemmatimonadota bacterium]